MPRTSMLSGSKRSPSAMGWPTMAMANARLRPAGTLTASSASFRSSTCVLAQGLVSRRSSVMGGNSAPATAMNVPAICEPPSRGSWREVQSSSGSSKVTRVSRFESRLQAASVEATVVMRAATTMRVFMSFILSSWAACGR